MEMFVKRYPEAYITLPRVATQSGIRENRENGQNKFPAGKNQGISKFKKNQGTIREFYKK